MASRGRMMRAAAFGRWKRGASFRCRASTGSVAFAINAIHPTRHQVTAKVRVSSTSRWGGSERNVHG
ncbi:MAG TPA: hypothetical protein VFS85_11885 [Dongiaceae bacterium]|nr:hypothetical protein [Dongiaceae bacterium]